MNEEAPAAAMAVTAAQNSGRPNNRSNSNSNSTSSSSGGFTEQQQQPMKGVRLRKWGRWVAEIRMPKTRQKIWLGSYHTRDEAALAYDAALYCLRGPTAKFNFPARLPDIPAASSLSRAEIQAAAAKYALGLLPALPRSAKNDSSSSSKSSRNHYNNHNNSSSSTSAAAEKFSASSSPSPSWSGSSEIAGPPPPAALLDDDVDVWAAIFGNPAPQQHQNSGNGAQNSGGGGGGLLSLDKMPSLDVMEMENYLFPVPSPVPGGQPSSAFADDLALWDFGEF